MDSAPKTPLLDRVKTPEDLRKLEESELPQLADELRAVAIEALADARVTAPGLEAIARYSVERSR